LERKGWHVGVGALQERPELRWNGFNKKFWLLESVMDGNQKKGLLQVAVEQVTPTQYVADGGGNTVIRSTEEWTPPPNRALVADGADQAQEGTNKP